MSGLDEQTVVPELPTTGDFKVVHSYRKRHIILILLYSGMLTSMVRILIGDLLAIVLFVTSALFMWYVHIGGFIQGTVVQKEHGGSAFPPSGLDFTGHFGIWFYDAWGMLKDEEKTGEYNFEVAKGRHAAFEERLRRDEELAKRE